MTYIDTFRAETRAWLEANCPAEMRTPMRSLSTSTPSQSKMRSSKDMANASAPRRLIAEKL